MGSKSVIALVFISIICVNYAAVVQNPKIHKLTKRETRETSVDPNGKYVGKFNEDCSETLLITPVKKIAHIEPDKEILEEHGESCHWNIIGTENCVPVLTCKKFHLEGPTAEGDDACPDEYLEVTDGSQGFDKFCGTTGPTGISSGLHLRELYITMKTSKHSKVKKRELKCEITCSQGKVESKPLEENSQPEIDDTCNCGRKPNSDRIVGGEDTKKGEFPWMAALVTSGTRKPFCGGSLINNKFILTAAHCFKGPYLKAQNLQILLNAHNMDLTSAAVAKGEKGSSAKMTPEELREADDKESSLRYSVERYFIHPLYIRQTNDFDVALIKLDKAIDFQHIKLAKPICLPKLGAYKESKEGVTAIVAGWGLNHSDATATMSVMQKLEVKVFKNAECKEFFDARFTRRMLCAGHKEAGKDSCKGDSGGPLIAEKTKQVWEQIGVVSWGEGCAQKNSPGVYANTREISQWVRYISNMEEATWCVG